MDGGGNVSLVTRVKRGVSIRRSLTIYMYIYTYFVLKSNRRLPN